MPSCDANVRSAPSNTTANNSEYGELVNSGGSRVLLNYSQTRPLSVVGSVHTKDATKRVKENLSSSDLAEDPYCATRKTSPNNHRIVFCGDWLVYSPPILDIVQDWLVKEQQLLENFALGPSNCTTWTLTMNTVFLASHVLWLYLLVRGMGRTESFAPQLAKRTAKISKTQGYFKDQENDNDSEDNLFAVKDWREEERTLYDHNDWVNHRNSNDRMDVFWGLFGFITLFTLFVAVMI